MLKVNRAHQLDPLSPTISFEVGIIHIWARQYDEAIVVCKKVANENPTFAHGALLFSQAYWGKRMYPQVIEEWKAYGQLSGDRNESEFASALEQGFRSAGWKGALTKALKPGKRNARPATRLRTGLLSLMPTWETKIKLSSGSTPLIRSTIGCWMGLKTDFSLDPLRSDPRFAELVRKVGLPQ